MRDLVAMLVLCQLILSWQGVRFPPRPAGIGSSTTTHFFQLLSELLWPASHNSLGSAGSLEMDKTILLKNRTRLRATSAPVVLTKGIKTGWKTQLFWGIASSFTASGEQHPSYRSIMRLHLDKRVEIGLLPNFLAYWPSISQLFWRQ